MKEQEPMPSGNYVMVPESTVLQIDGEGDISILYRAVIVAPEEYAGRKVEFVLRGYAQEGDAK